MLNKSLHLLVITKTVIGLNQHNYRLFIQEPLCINIKYHKFHFSLQLKGDERSDEEEDEEGSEEERTHTHSNGSVTGLSNGH